MAPSNGSSRRAAKSHRHRPLPTMARFISARATGNFTPSRRRQTQMDLRNRRVGGFLAGHRRRRDGLFRFLGHKFLRAESRWLAKMGFRHGRYRRLLAGHRRGRHDLFRLPRQKILCVKTGRDGSLDFCDRRPKSSLRPPSPPDGTIYFTSTDGNLYALRPDGTERWRLHTGGATESSPVLDEDGNIYLSVNELDLSVGSDGKKRWDCGMPVLVERHRLSPRRD